MAKQQRRGYLARLSRREPAIGRHYGTAIRSHGELCMPGRWNTVSWGGRFAIASHADIDPRSCERFLPQKKFVKGKIRYGSGVASRLLRHRPPATTFEASLVVSQRLIRNADRGVILFIDLEREQLLRVATTAFSQEYFDMRAELETVLPCIPYWRTDYSNIIGEKVAKGPVAMLSTDEEVDEVVTFLLDRLLPTTGSHEQDRMYRATESRSDAVTEHATQGKGAPLVASHGDLHLNNFCVHAAAPTIIDFGSLARRPPWFDGLHMLVRVALDRPETAPRMRELAQEFVLGHHSGALGSEVLSTVLDSYWATLHRTAPSSRKAFHESALRLLLP